MKTLLALSFLLLMNSKIVAQTNDTIQIEEIVIKDTIYYRNNIIDVSKQVDFSKTSGELLQQIPGVSITKRSSFSIEPTINAFKYDQVNTTINSGITGSSSCPNRMDPITTRIAPEEIKQIIVVRGPYEMRYGQIMGGYINLITHKNPNYEKLSFGGNIASEHNFNGNGSLSSLNLKGGNKLFDISLNANYRKFDNYISGDGTEISSSYNTYGFNSAVGLNISERQRVLVNYMYSQANDVMHAGLPMDAKFDKSNMLSLDYEFKNISTLITGFKLKVFTANEDHLMTNEYRPNALNVLANTPVTSYDFGGRLEFKLQPIKNGIVYFGTDFKQIAKDGIKEVTIYKNICTSPVATFPIPKEKTFKVWQNSYSQDFGVFLDFKYYLSEKTKLKAGIRNNFNKSDIKDPEQNFYNLYNGELTPDNILTFNYYAQASYKLPKNYIVELSLGHGTRNPSLLERYINHFTVGLDAYEYVGNPHLLAEINNQVNLTLNKKHKNFYTYVDVFYSQIQNYITAIEDTSIRRISTPCKEPKFAKHFTNIDNAMQYGANFGANIHFLKYFNANIDLTYVYAQNLDFNEPLPEIAPFTSIISIAYKRNNLTVKIQNEYQAKQERISSLVGEQKSEEFTVFNINASYLFFKKLNFGLGVNNILNANYYRHLSRPYKNMDTSSMFYEPGRNFRIFVKYKF